MHLVTISRSHFGAVRALSARAALAALAAAAMLTGCSSGSSTERTSAAPVAKPSPTITVNSQQEADQALAACLRDHGWTATVDPTGGVEVPFPPDQTDQYLADNSECSSGLGYRKWTDADYETVYEGLEKSVACLVDAGYPTPDQTPSLQTFTEQRQSPSGEFWDPYGLVPADQLTTALNTCPEPDPIY